MKKFTSHAVVLATAILFQTGQAMAQATGVGAGGISKGLDAATTELQDVGTTVSKLMLPVCLIMGFVGGIQVYSKWSNNDPDFRKAAVNWGSAIIFAGIVGLVLNAVFG